MHLEQINQRLDDLFALLQYCSEERKTFTIGERICINFERGCLFDRKNYLLHGFNFHLVRAYKQEPETEQKIQRTLTKMKADNFVAYDTSWFLDPTKTENEY